jgi:hypothetical protein
LGRRKDTLNVNGAVCDPQQLDLQADGCGSQTRAPQIGSLPVFRLDRFAAQSS